MAKAKAKKTPPKKTPPKKPVPVRRGRPAGAKTSKPPVCNAPPSCCPRCGSIAREKYFNTVEHAIAGFDDRGRQYTHVVWRRTKCSDCGQARIDRSFENRAAKTRRVA